MKLPFGLEIKRSKQGSVKQLADDYYPGFMNPLAAKLTARFYNGERSFAKLVTEGLYSNPAVAGCIATWTMTMNEAPIRERDSKGNFIDAKRSPITALFKKPSPNMSGALLFQYVAQYCGLGGNCYLHKLRNSRKEILRLIPYSDAQIQPVPGDSSEKSIDYYQYNFANTRYEIATEDIIHLRSHIPDPLNPIKGLSPLRLCANSVDNNNFLDTIIYSTLSNDATPSTIVVNKGEPFEEQQRKDLEGKWREKFGTKRGKHKRETIAFLPVNLGVERVGMTFEELVSEGLWTKFEMDVCASYRVPVSVALLYASIKTSSYNNREQDDRAYTKRTVIPMWNLWEEQIQIGMAMDYPDADVEFDTSAIQALQPSPEESQKQAVALYQSSIITKNEAREITGFSPTNDGDTFFEQPSATLTIGSGAPAKTSIRSLPIALKTKSLYSEEFKAQRSNEHRELIEKHAPKIEAAFAKEAGELEKAYLNSVKSSGTEYSTLTLTLLARSKAFNWSSWEKRFEKATEEQRLTLIEEVIGVAWSQVDMVEEIGTPYDAIVNDALKQSTSMIADSIGTIKDELKELLANNAEATAQELTDLIKQRFETIKGSRAANIGQTTANATANGTQKSVWDEANTRIEDEGEKIKRQWLSARAANTRHAHAAADGQVEDEDGMFTLNGNKCPYPSGGGLPAKDACNCHCTTIPVRAKDIK